MTAGFNMPPSANPEATKTRCACCNSQMPFVQSQAAGVRTFKHWCTECVSFAAKSPECEEAMRVLQDQLLTNSEWVAKAKENRVNKDWDEALKSTRPWPAVGSGRFA